MQHNTTRKASTDRVCNTKRKAGRRVHLAILSINGCYETERKWGIKPEKKHKWEHICPFLAKFFGGKKA